MAEDRFTSYKRGKATKKPGKTKMSEPKIVPRTESDFMAPQYDSGDARPLRWLLEREDELYVLGLLIHELQVGKYDPRFTTRERQVDDLVKVYGKWRREFPDLEQRRLDRQ